MDYSSGIYDDVSVIQEFAKNYMIVISTNNPRSILEYKLKVLKDIMNISHVFSSVSDFDKIRDYVFEDNELELILMTPLPPENEGDGPSDIGIPRTPPGLIPGSGRE